MPFYYPLVYINYSPDVVKRRTRWILGVAVLLLGAALLLLLKDDILENWRMHNVALKLESSIAVKNKYGSGCSIKSVDRGRQSALVFAAGAYHQTRFRISGNGNDKTVWVKWIGKLGEFDVDVLVYDFTELPTPWTGHEEILR